MMKQTETLQKPSKKVIDRECVDLHSVLELEVNGHANGLVITQNSGGHDRRAQESSQISGGVDTSLKRVYPNTNM